VRWLGAIGVILVTLLEGVRWLGAIGSALLSCIIVMFQLSQCDHVRGNTGGLSVSTWLGGALGQGLTATGLNKGGNVCALRKGVGLTGPRSGLVCALRSFVSVAAVVDRSKALCFSDANVLARNLLLDRILTCRRILDRQQGHKSVPETRAGRPTNGMRKTAQTHFESALIPWISESIVLETFRNCGYPFANGASTRFASRSVTAADVVKARVAPRVGSVTCSVSMMAVYGVGEQGVKESDPATHNPGVQVAVRLVRVDPVEDIVIHAVVDINIVVGDVWERFSPRVVVRSERVCWECGGIELSS
jgi:hypothetical protein